MAEREKELVEAQAPVAPAAAEPAPRPARVQEQLPETARVRITPLGSTYGRRVLREGESLTMPYAAALRRVKDGEAEFLDDRRRAPRSA
jgi:hypothetical protein